MFFSAVVTCISTPGGVARGRASSVVRVSDHAHLVRLAVSGMTEFA